MSCLQFYQSRSTQSISSFLPRLSTASQTPSPQRWWTPCRSPEKKNKKKCSALYGLIVKVCKGTCKSAALNRAFVWAAV